ncbi:hypothetical protein ACOKFD_15590 [Flagellimonas sp. S174]|uniref:hypothetical protein n=1 Tax=Flagellimonas sp. S174 TaxID=3410790 RepID=UPI003BF46325
MTQLEKAFEEKKTRSERIWILLFRTPGVLIFFLPFIPITISYINTDIDKLGLDSADWQMIGIGFFLVWGSQYFGIIANKIGAWMLKKVGLN